ncbi:uncharacterized protein LOC111623894 [Centruroides sculpturatus]|uniref:uncharacterized protein LOC111623894 n=1 Tax=Centruroides sculpturatus TaxID=218467 RepID=UPI000C6E41F8|nr:uncharacterized protein LOC111623894 [Centruroides sculpturatus]
MRFYFWFGDFKRKMFSFILKKKCFKRFKVFCRNRKVHPIEDGGTIDDSVYPIKKKVCTYANFQQASSKIGDDITIPPLSDHNHSDKLYREEVIKMNELCYWWEMHNTLQEQRFPNVRPCISDDKCEETSINSMIWETTYYAENQTHQKTPSTFILHQPKNLDERPVEKLQRLTRFLMKFAIYRFPKRNENESVERTINRMLVSAQMQDILIPSPNVIIRKHCTRNSNFVVEKHKEKGQEKHTKLLRWFRNIFSWRHH